MKWRVVFIPAELIAPLPKDHQATYCGEIGGLHGTTNGITS